MCSVNQLNAKIKLTEMWKATYVPNHNLNVKAANKHEDLRSSRSITNGKLIEGFSNLATNTFLNDATRAWNKAPKSIKDSCSIHSAKKEIKKFVMSLPT